MSVFLRASHGNVSRRFYTHHLELSRYFVGRFTVNYFKIFFRAYHGEFSGNYI